MLTNNEAADRGFIKKDPVENPRIAALKAALAALTYSDMMGVATNLSCTLPNTPAAYLVAASINRYINTATPPPRAPICGGQI